MAELMINCNDEYTLYYTPVFFKINHVSQKGMKAQTFDLTCVISRVT